MFDTDSRWVRPFAFAASVLALLAAVAPASAALSERGGTGVWEVQSAESHRPARLELGFFSSYQRLGLRDSADTQLNGSLIGASAVFGIPGGFELSGAIPIFNYYTSFGSSSSLPDENFDLNVGDLTGRLRWSGPLGLGGLRWGVEGEVRFATGENKRVVYAGRDTTRPFTARKNDYTARAMLTWDGLRTGSGAPLRVHANAAYTFQGDESRYNVSETLLPLELGAPMRNRDNDYLTIGGAIEIDLPRLTLFGEAVTNQFVNQRMLMAGKENRFVVTPGVRFWLPGGVSIGGAYSFNVSDDDGGTSFDPGRAFPRSEWRIAVSLGTVYRGARARMEDALVAAPDTPVLPASQAPVATSAPDTLKSEKASKTEAILARRQIQETPPAPKDTVTAAAPATPTAAPPLAPPMMRTVTRVTADDVDGDGIPNVSDRCPTLPEDWDGFQDFDGCPDVDNDQDGFPDDRDQCPNDPETFNGFYDFDGCPDDVQTRWIGRPGSGPTGAVTTPQADSLTALSAAPAGPAPTLPTTTAPGARAADSLRSALAAERERADMLASRLLRADSVRTAAVRARDDTLRMALESERTRVDILKAEVARTDSLRTALAAERRRSEMLSARVATPDSIPAPVGIGTIDTLEMALAAERQRANMLEARLSQVDAERRQLVDRAIARPRVDTVLADRSPDELRQMIIADRERQAAMQARLESLQDRQDQLAFQQGSRTTMVAPPGGTTVVTPRGEGSGGNSELEARIAMLEARLAAEPSAPASSASTQAPASPPAPNAELMARVESLQVAVQSLSTEPAPPVQRVNGALESLDLLLPVGQPRVFPEFQFATRSTSPSAESRLLASRLADLLARVPESRILVIGHTDSRGAESFNMQISQERARAIADVLASNGVARSQISVEGRGEAQPLSSNATAEGRRNNRRVEILRTQ